MAVQLPGFPSCSDFERDEAIMCTQEVLQGRTSQWYFSREEIEDHSPSRKDGIDYRMESQLRSLFCSFLHELGVELKVPQLTIATAMMLCHRFYVHQSHAKNDWQTIATVSMFLACKAEETPRWLSDVIVVAYKLLYKRDPTAPERIRQRETYDKQKQLLLTGERLLLSTVAFDLNIEHPYKPLVTALKRLEVSQKELAKVAWNFVNDWLRTTLCLQHKPHYIAAASLYFAAKLQKVKLPTEQGKVWWLQFDVSPKKLGEVIQQMRTMLEHNQKQARPVACGITTESKPVIGKATSVSQQSCILSGSVITQESGYGTTLDAGQPVNSDVSKCSPNQSCNNFRVAVKEPPRSDCGSSNSIVEDGCGEPKPGESDENSSCKVVFVQGDCGKIDINRIREAIKRRRDRVVNKRLAEKTDDEINSEAWIERELENGIEPEFARTAKKSKRF